MAGWQCAAGRAILRLEAREFAPLAGTTKNTILRFESGEFMPRPVTVIAIEKMLRERGIIPTFDRHGEPLGILLKWQAYAFAYPEGYKRHKHRRPEEWAQVQRERAAAAAPDNSPINPVPPSPARRDDLAMLEAKQQRLLAELARMKAYEANEDDDEAFDF